jgi:DNA mismatch endonuclease (patch repair protein)
MTNITGTEIIKTPRFSKSNGFVTTIERSLLMSKIKSKNTKCEVLMRKALWAMGIRYRKNNQALPGKPDITILKYKIIIFIDGEFWHGYNWPQKKCTIKTNRDFWIPKIERTMQRDAANNIKLQELGYRVFRFWEKQVTKDTVKCISEIMQYISLHPG